MNHSLLKQVPGDPQQQRWHNLFPLPASQSSHSTCATTFGFLLLSHALSESVLTITVLEDMAHYVLILSRWASAKNLERWPWYGTVESAIPMYISTLLSTPSAWTYQRFRAFVPSDFEWLALDVQWLAVDSKWMWECIGKDDFQYFSYLPYLRKLKVLIILVNWIGLYGDECLGIPETDEELLNFEEINIIRKDLDQYFKG